jgi:hypothetical protein
MTLTTKEITELKKIVARANELIAQANGRETVNTSARRSTSAKTRRTGKDLLAFRRMLKAERKAGVPVTEIAKKHGVTPSYIYQIG